MGVRGKGGGKEKVVRLRKEVGVVYDGSILQLADDTGLCFDDLFLMLFTLCMTGMVLPHPRGQKDGTLRLGWLVSRNERETQEMREMLVKGIDEHEKMEDKIEVTRERVFGKLLRGEYKKG